MTDNLKKIIEETLTKTPNKIKDIIDNSNWIKASEEIGKKYLTTEEEINSLQAEIFLILIGLIDKEVFQMNLESRIGLSKNEAEKISKEVDESIFIPIFNKMEEEFEHNNEYGGFSDFEKNIYFITSSKKII